MTCALCNGCSIWVVRAEDQCTVQRDPDFGWAAGTIGTELIRFRVKEGNK